MNVKQLSLDVLTVLALSTSPALAQWGWDTHWNSGGPRPLSCMFNGNEHFAGDEVCIRPGAKQICNADGTFGPPQADTSCTGAETGTHTFSHLKVDNGLPHCASNDIMFGVGAEICVAPGAKQVCKADGTLSAPLKENTCSGRLATTN